MSDAQKLLKAYQRQRATALAQLKAQTPGFGVGAYRTHGPGKNPYPVQTPHGVRKGYAWRPRAGFIGQAPPGSSSIPTPIVPAPYYTAHPGNGNGRQPVPVPPSNLPVPTNGGYPPGTVPMPPNGYCPPAPCPPTATVPVPVPVPQPCPPEPYCPPPSWCDPGGGPIDECSSMGRTGGVSMYCDTIQPCGVNVIGQNTLGTDGITPGATVPVTITAGDAAKFMAKAIYFEAQPFSTPDLVDPTALPNGCCSLPILLVDALVGRISQLRRGGSPDLALTQGAYANTKELVPVDWAPFTSTTEHNLTLLFYNPNINQTVHVNVVLWGDI